jgi:hypothetical protein
MKNTGLLLSALCIFSPVSAWVSGVGGRFKALTSTALSSAASEEALSVFAQKYPFNRPVEEGKTVKRFTDMSEPQVRSSFEDLAKVYGEEPALDMVKAMPVVLTFNSKNFAPALKGFADTFGEEESKAMVSRNVRTTRQ